MVNYANGKIYKICPISGEDEYYIGSTTKKYLSTRMSTHRYDFLNKSYCSKSKILFDKYGIENCKIVLIKYFPCNCKEELDAEEAKHIKNNNCVNKQIPGRTVKEWRKDNKEKIAENKKQYYQDNKEQVLKKTKQYYQNNKEHITEHTKQYYQDNKDKIAEYKKQYRQVNKDKIAEYQKQYKQDNKEQIKEKDKQYYQDNKEHLKTKYHCICGSILTINSKTRHEKTATHIKGEQEFYDGCEQALLELELNNNK